MIRIEDLKKLGEVHNDHAWGYEVWIENNYLYCGKLLVLENKCKSSYHYHKQKTETFLCLSGEIRLKVFPNWSDPANITDEKILNFGDKVTIYRGQIHQFNAESDKAVILEISTHHEDEDTYRLA